MAFSPFGIVRETWVTLAAVVRLMRNFFVRWFLPLHVEEEEPDREGRDWEEGESSLLPPLRSDEVVNSVTSDDGGLPETGAPPAQQPVAPVIAPPTGDADRVSRGPAGWTRAEPWADLQEADEAEEAARQQEQGAEAPPQAAGEETEVRPEAATQESEPDSDPENPFAPDSSGERR